MFGIASEEDGVVIIFSFFRGEGGGARYNSHIFVIICISIPRSNFLRSIVKCRCYKMHLT